MKVLLDCDGVIANFVKGACLVHKKKDPYSGTDNIGNGNLEKIWQMTTEEFIDPMGYEFWRDLEKMPQARQIVSILETAFGVENICILTKPTDTSGACDGKRAWIYKHFPQYADRYLIGTTKTFCSHSNSILIDDYEKNCRKFINQGGRAFLVPAPWNYRYLEDPLEGVRKTISKLFALGLAV